MGPELLWPADVYPRLVRIRRLKRVARGSENGLEIRDALAALFPNAFSAEPWRVHRPLKVGIGNDLVARGVLGARELNAALSRYVDRLMYQKCLAAGGARVDLDGNVAGEVSREQRCRAERLVARFKARQLAEAAAAKAEPESERTLTRAALPPSILNGKVLIMPPPCRNDAT